MVDDSHASLARYLEENVLGRPAYSRAMAARLVGLTEQRVSRWLKGYSYDYAPAPGRAPVRRSQQPVIHTTGMEGPLFASFLDVVDLLFVKAFLGKGISLQRLRQALVEAERILGRPRFAYREFWTDGRNIYLEVKNQGDALLQLLSGGQWTFAEIICQIASHMDFDEATGFTERWFPLGRETPVVIDPKISFGAPTVFRRGIATANVYDMYLAEDKNPRRVCSWFDLRRGEVEAAVEFETRLAAA